MEADVAGLGRDLAWRAEQALNHAWPSLEEIRGKDWTARFGAGLTRRNNSANPHRADARLDEADILACEAAFDRWGLRRTFRLPSFLAPGIDQTLEQAGYAREGETVTLFAPIDGLPDASDPRTRIEPLPGAAWLAAKVEFSGLTPEESVTWRQVAGRLTVPAGFAGLSEDGALASLAYGAIDDGLLCVEAVVTDPARRGRGLGRRMLASLIAWGRGLGRPACACRSRPTTPRRWRFTPPSDWVASSTAIIIAGFRRPCIDPAKDVPLCKELLRVYIESGLMLK